MDPINYVSLIAPPNLAQAAGQGLALGNALHDRFRVRPQEEADAASKRALEIEALNQQQARAQSYQTDVSAVLNAPTPEGYRQLLLKYPEQREALESGWKGYSQDQQQRNLEAATSVYGYLSSGNTGAALNFLKDRRKALEGSGETIDTTEALISMLESGDPAKVEQARGLAGFVIAGAVGPDKVGSTLDSLGIGGKAVLEERQLDQQAARDAETARHNRAVEANNSREVSLSERREGRIAAGGGSSGGGAKPRFTTLKPGQIVGGKRFLGGNPSDRKNWQ